MTFCPYCMSRGCCKRAVRLVSDAELSNPEFVRRVRAFAARLNISPSAMLDHLLNEFARIDCEIVDARGRRVDLQMEAFEPTDADIDLGRAPRVRARITEWFAALIAPCPDHVRPRVRSEAKVRFRIVATLLRALHPYEALTWNVANDNNLPPLIPASGEHTSA